MKRYIGLVHHPIINKNGEIVTTSVTNLDIHDIARSARTYGFDGYFIITPLEEQHKLVTRILDHWNTDVGNAYNPDRQDALSFVELKNSVEDACSEIERREGSSPAIVVTGANFKDDSGQENAILKQIKLDKKPLFLLFGTGWGLAQSVIDRADFMAPPLAGKAKDGYNHLSVRSAVAIYCDRFTQYID